MVLDQHLLVCYQVQVTGQLLGELDYLTSRFCGCVFHLDDDGLQNLSPLSADGNIYFCGDAAAMRGVPRTTDTKARIVRELCTNTSKDSEHFDYVSLGEVPLNFHNLAVYDRSCLDSSKDYFHDLQAKHQVQKLTESNKEFNLLGYSSNLEGPTLAFAEEDRQIMARVRVLANENFELLPSLNRVLAQVHKNSMTVNSANKTKEHKASIKSHSDKTKDMPVNGVIAFCTFYSPDRSTYKANVNDRFDRCYKNQSVLTRIRFKSKLDDGRSGQQ
ncbi:hypothetical protein DOTSEDRAFT_32894 [Dothistroma septosporum NZE10]|uniref:Uncharacterized protein n=1 Tax=Dothistroma septosporum (strain NZE10 / CBS 128990) TaxID=675120 RepID=N1PTF5_DOTSN|nr:hypothetical protein DOTSEDRAFT_32894 [Dothistroma septosporum NZE10]